MDSQVCGADGGTVINVGDEEGSFLQAVGRWDRWVADGGNYLYDLQKEFGVI